MKREVLFIILIIIFLMSCATGSIRETSAPRGDLSNYKNIYISISADPPQWSWEVYELKDILSEKIRRSKLINKITSDADKADLKVYIIITAVKRVDKATRMVTGAWAGRAGLNAEIRLYDTQSDNCIASFDAYGRSSGGTIFAGTTKQAIERTADQIYRFLEDNL